MEPQKIVIGMSGGCLTFVSTNIPGKITVEVMDEDDMKETQGLTNDQIESANVKACKDMRDLI